MKTYPAPSALQVRPSFRSAGTFSLYWVVPGTNLGIPVENRFTKPFYTTVYAAIMSTTVWHGKRFSRVAKPATIVTTPMENMLVRVSK